MVFLGYCIEASNLDMFNGPYWYEKAFTFSETRPFNQIFELFGVDSMNYMMNSASIPITRSSLVPWWLILTTLYSLYCPAVNRFIISAEVSASSLSWSTWVGLWQMVLRRADWAGRSAYCPAASQLALRGVATIPSCVSLSPRSRQSSPSSTTFGLCRCTSRWHFRC